MVVPSPKINLNKASGRAIISCMTCKHNGSYYCPFHEGYTSWDDVYCSKYEEQLY